MTLAILIPAAGSATRMRGGDKLLEHIDGQPLLRRQAELALTLTPLVLVTLRAADPDRLAALHDLPLHKLAVPDAAEGMAASLRTGAAAALARNARALMILPADMPDLTRDDLALLIAAVDQDPDSLHRATTAQGTPGHPVVIPRRLIGDLLHLTGDAGARSLIARHPVRLHPLPENHALTDLDTPEDWAAWRALRGE